MPFCIESVHAATGSALPTGAGHGGPMTLSEAELTPGRPRRRWHLFRNARLNWVGWTALACASLGSAALGVAVSAQAGWSPWIGAVIGLPLVTLVLLVLDRRRTWLGVVGFGWTDQLAEVEAVAEELGRRGVDVSVQEASPSLTFRRRDQRVVAEVLGLPPGRYPWQ
jgi:hypothetical protein